MIKVNIPEGKFVYHPIHGHRYYTGPMVLKLKTLDGFDGTYTDGTSWDVIEGAELVSLPETSLQESDKDDKSPNKKKTKGSKSEKKSSVEESSEEVKNDSKHDDSQNSKTLPQSQNNTKDTQATGRNKKE